MPTEAAPHVKLILNEQPRDLAPAQLIIPEITTAQSVELSTAWSEERAYCLRLRGATEADVQVLRETAARYQDLTPAQRAARLEEIELELSDVARKAGLLEQIRLGRTMSADQFIEHLRKVQGQVQALEMALSDKQVRREVITDAMHRRRQERARKADDDAVLRTLQTISELHRTELEKTQEAHRSGAASTADVREAELRHRQAELQVAEREEALQHDDEILERLNAELQMLLMDMRELSLKRAQLQEREPLVAVDLETLTAEGFEDLVQKHPRFAYGNAGIKRVRQHYAEQRKQLLMEKFGLLVNRVESCGAENPATAPAERR